MKKCLALLSLLIGIFLYPYSGQAEALDKVNIQLKWFHQFQFAGLYAAKEKGFYTEEGLDVNLIERDPSVSHIDQVVEGKAEYGIADSGLLLSRLNGKPVTILAQIFQHSPLVYLTLQSSNLQMPHHLTGKKVMTESLGHTDAALNAMLLKTLGSLNQVELTKHSYRNEDLIDGRVDAMLAYSTNEAFWFKERGIPVRTIDPRDYGIDFYGDNLFTTDGEIRNHPERTAKMVRATIKGWNYALDHKDEVIDLILRKYNSQNRTREHLAFEANQTEAMINRRFIKLGHFEPTRYQKIAGIYTELAIANSFIVDQNFYHAPRKLEVVLSPEETAWLDGNRKISVHNETDWPPFNFAKDGQTLGYSIDIMNLLAKKIGLEVEYVTGPTWNEFLEMMKAGTLDVMLNIVKTPERLKYLLYTPPYANNPNTILSRNDTPYHVLQELFGKTVSVPKGFFYEEILKRDYPQIIVKTVDNTLDSMKAVSFGTADAAFGELAVFNYLIKENLMADLTVSGEVKLGDPEYALLNIATRKDLPILASILSKGVQSVTGEERQHLLSKWMSGVTASEAAPAPEEESSPILTFLVLSVGLLLIFGLFVFVIGRSKKEQDLSAYFGGPAFTASVLAGLSALVAVVVVMNWLAISDSKKKTTETVGEQLHIILNSSIERLNTWISDRQAFLRQMGRDPKLVKITKRLLQVDRNHDSLISSIALADARAFFASNKKFGPVGFFIISPDNISIGSRRNTNVGTKNFITEVRPDLIERAFRGEAVFIPPIRSDVKIDSSEKDGADKKPLTMFFSSPITDEYGSVLAVLTERIIPSGPLSKILHFGQVGKTGEIYAFNGESKMVSESRFKDSLVEIGLISPDTKDTAELEIRNPGGDLTKGYQPDTNRENMPLTHMMADALRLIENDEGYESSTHDQPTTKHPKNIKGYPDYRGVPVAGAWNWLPDLELGIAAEIDLDEAMANHVAFRFNLIVISAIATILAIGATLFTLMLGQRAHRSLSKARDELEDRVVERTQELQDSEKRTRAIIDNAPDGVIIISEKGEIQNFSPAAEVIFGYTPDEVVGKNIKMLMPEPRRSEHDGYLKRYLQTGEARIVGMNREVVGLGKDGNEFPMDLSVGEALLGNERIFTGIVRDITERKRAEVELRVSKTKAEEATKVAEEATKAKATFLATMSHEIRTPMGGVIGMVDLLQQSNMTDDQRQMIDTVGDSAHSLLTIINDILDFSKIEAGKLDLEEIPISIRDVVEGAGEALAVNAKNKNIGLSVFVDPNIPNALVGDQVRLRQILFNFGTNAIKFTEQGKVFLRADKIPSEDKGKATVRFQVIDEGIGIPEEAQKKLFQAFSQVDASTTRKFGGTGLGLTICQRLTEIMNGEIGVESVEGEGSTFSATVTFPVAEEHTFKSDGHDLEGLNVLLAHKDDDMRGLIPRYLEHWKATVTVTAEIDQIKPMTLDAAKDGSPFDIIYLGSGWTIDEQVDAVRSLQAEKTLSSTGYVVGCRDRVRADRPEIDNTVYVDAGPLRRAAFIKGVAVAAGRASPEVEHDDSEITLDAGKAPTVEEAEAMGQLILLAEDNVTNQDVIRRQLTMLGYALEIANDGKEALDLLETRNFAILLTDCHMPNMDGFELTKTIRKSEKDKDARFPIIAVTASVMKEEVDQCFAAGMDDFIAKPMEMQKAKEMLHKWMPEAEGVVVEASEEAAAEDTTDKPEAEEGGDGGNGAIDPTALKSVFGDDDATFKEILNDFVEPATSNVGEIEASFADRSADGVAKAAHKLKSSARSVGANELADLCQILETAGKAENWDEIDKAAPRLPGTIEKVVKYMDNL